MLKLGSLKQDLGLKFVAALISLALWLYVKSLEEPMTNLVYSVPLRVSGQSRDVRVIDMPSEVSVNVSVPTSELSTIDRTKLQEELRAWVDLSNPRPGGADYGVILVPPDKTRKYAWDWDRRVSIITEAVARKSFTVELVPTGSAPQELEFANALIEPERIIVEAGETFMSRIATARVLLNLETAQSGRTQELQIELLDANDRPITSESVRPSPQKVRVTPALAPTQPRRNLVVSPIWSGQAALGYRVIEARIEPAAITVEGPRNRLQGLSVIETDPISLEGLQSDTTLRVNLKAPEGVKIQGGRKEVRVRIKLVKVETTPTTETNPARE